MHAVAPRLPVIDSMTEVSVLGLTTAFAAGVVSFLSPCVLPLVPGYVSYLAGQSVIGRRHRSGIGARLPAVVLSLFFVAGFSSVFVALGASATALGQWLIEYRHAASVAGGALIVIFGLYTTGLLQLRVLQRDIHFHLQVSGGKALSAYLVGLAFGFGWTPCIGPVLGAILTMSAIASSVAAGVLLLAAYSLGLGVPFLVAAAFTDRLVARQREVKRIGRILYIVAGAVMVVTGIAIITGHLSLFAIWLLQTFPALGNAG
jgi:cytochrome c-type biogenesis protein